jgi:hypothetical protein
VTQPPTIRTRVLSGVAVTPAVFPDTSSSTTPEHTAVANSQSRSGGQRRCWIEANTTTNSSWTDISGCTAATEPAFNAAA